MAGHILKIVIEDTHPPVWRRIIIPEKITFADLHEMIQIIFGWYDDHPHEFTIPSADICIDSLEEVWCRYHYAEWQTCVEQFFPKYKWVRYTYDFGDDWRHKIIYEKTDESYDKRYATLIKAKGENFQEDSGGVWASAYQNFNWEETDRALKKLVCFPYEVPQEERSEGDMPDIDRPTKDFIEKFCDYFHRQYSKNVQEHRLGCLKK